MVINAKITSYSLPQSSVLVYSYAFSQEAPSLYSRIYDEFALMSKFVKLIVVAEEFSVEETQKLSLIKVSKVSLPILHVIYRALVFYSASFRLRKNYSTLYLRVLDFGYLASAILVKKFLKKKLVLWISNAETGHRGVRRKLYRYLYKKIFSMADAICCSSTNDIVTVENYMNEKIDKQKLFVIKPGVNTNRFQPKNATKKEKILLYVGRIVPIKLIEYLVEALPIIQKSHPDVILKLVGPIGDRKYYEKLKSLSKKLNCEKNVLFIGPIPYHKLPDYYNSAQIFLQPTESAGTSTVTFEAMACANPVIVAPAGARLELIEDGKSGFLLENKKPDVLAKKVIELLNNDNYRESIGREARKLVEEKLNFTEHIKKLVNVINNVSVKI